MTRARSRMAIRVSALARRYEAHRWAAYTEEGSSGSWMVVAGDLDAPGGVDVVAYTSYKGRAERDEARRLLLWLAGDEPEEAFTVGKRYDDLGGIEVIDRRGLAAVVRERAACSAFPGTAYRRLGLRRPRGAGV